MPQIAFSVPHSLPVDTLLAKAKPAIEGLVEEFNGTNLSIQQQGTLTRFSFSVFMWSVTGQTEATDDSIQVRLELPPPALMMQSQIQAAVIKHLQESMGG